MKIFTVTFCAMDQEADANPFWHACLLLSRLDEKMQKLEVVDHWGFYGVPTTIPDSFIRQLKISIGLDVDFTENHGMLRHEETRFLDLGRGLHGVTFELSEEKFHELQFKCKKMAEDQAHAIKEIAEPLKLPTKPAGNKIRMYAHEHLSNHIYALEKARAQSENRSPRLRPFEIKVSMGLRGLSFNNSSGCKSQAVKLLESVLSPEQIARLTSNGKHRAIPRLSGKMETIHLHSNGPLSNHKKHSGEIVYYRDGNNPDVQLHWTIPPQEIDTLSETTKALFKIDEECISDVRKIVRQLQAIEWLFRNAVLPEKYHVQQEALIHKAKNLYESFAVIIPSVKGFPKKSCSTFMLSLFSQPLNAHQADIMEKITRAKEFINDLYFAMTDNWAIDDDCRFEKEAEEKSDTSVNDEQYENPLEAITTALPLKTQKALFKIMDRWHIEPHPAAIPSRG